MSQRLSTLTGHVPPQVLDKNYLVRGFVSLFDAMEAERQDSFDYYRRTMLPLLANELKTMRWWVDNFAGEYTSETTLEALDCFYHNAYYIYSRKGTKLGLQRLIDCLLVGQPGTPVVEITDYVKGWPLILFDSWRPNDQLPSGQDLADEIVASPGKLVPTLLGFRWDDYKNEIILGVTSGSLSPTYETFLVTMCRAYCPMIGTYNFITTVE